MKNLCTVGVQLHEIAAAADRDFKSGLIEFFSDHKQDDEHRRRLEAMGVEQREADDAFNRHHRFCSICREVVLQSEGGQQRPRINRLA
jgi:hypothetical protein